MSLRLLRSAGLSVSLGIALLVSLLAHALRGGGSASREACRVVVVEAVGGSTQPEIRVDFDAPLALPADPNATLGAEYLSLEPAAPVDVRAAGARRLAVVPRRALAPFTTYRLRLGARLAATDGRPVVAEGAHRSRSRAACSVWPMTRGRASTTTDPRSSCCVSPGRSRRGASPSTCGSSTRRAA